MKQFLTFLLMGLILLGVNSCKKDEPTPEPSDRSFVTKYVKPQEFLQCDTTIALPWNSYGKPYARDYFCVVKGEVITPETNPIEFNALTLSNGDIGYTGPAFDTECLSEPLLGMKVTALEDIYDLVKKDEDMGNIIGVNIVDMYSFVSSHYKWPSGSASPFTTYRSLVEDFNPENGKMVDPRGISFSIEDRDFCRAFLSHPDNTYMAVVVNVKVTLTFPSGEISAPAVVYKLYAF